jgi:hypothetical protein
VAGRPTLTAPPPIVRPGRSKDEQEEEDDQNEPAKSDVHDLAFRCRVQLAYPPIRLAKHLSAPWQMQVSRSRRLGTGWPTRRKDQPCISD